MARKFVSGVLAFAMVFGATAPVVFAEPVATEVVDQEANYLPSLETSTLTMKKGDVTIVKVNDIGNGATIAEKTQDGVNVKYLQSSKSLIITCEDDAKLTTDGVKINLDITAGTDEAYGVKQLTLTVKKAATTGTITGWSKDIKLVAGKSQTFTIKYTDGSVPKNVTWKLTTLASEYVSISTSDKMENGIKTGVNVTLTGLKAVPSSMSADDKANLKFTLTVDGKSQGESKFNVTTASSVAALTLKVSTAKISVSDTTGAGAVLVAQAYKVNEYGDLAKDDEANKTLVWSINGVAGTELKNSKGTATIATLTKQSDGIMKFTATEAGTYTVSVADPAGTHTAPTTITVTNTVEPVEVYVAKSATDLTKVDASMTVKPGASIDLGALPYAGKNGDTKALMSAFTGWKATYSVDKTNLLSSYNQATGKFTIVGEKDVDLIAAMNNKDKTAVINAQVTFTKGSTTLKLPYTIKVTKAGAKAASITITDGANFKAIAGKGNNQSGAIADANEHYTSYVMSAGTTVNFNAVAKDTNEFTDVSQDMIWYVEKTYGNDTTTKPETIAVNNGGKLTALTENAGKVTFVGVSASNPNLKVYIQLYITATKPTATPTATATPAPTATTAPTTAPTTVPATKTGKVTASSLRVRETPVNGTVVGKLAKGTAVTILETKDGWYKVTAGSLTGWVSGEYVELTTPSTTETATTTANLKLRKTPKTGAVITTMKKGSKVEVLEKGTEWSKVKYNGKTGFAFNAYLEFEEDAVG